jgi:predicted porin
MMMMNSKIFHLFRALTFLCLLFFSAFINTHAQTKDFGAWYSISGRYEIINNLRLSISEELRTNSNASETDQFFTDLGVSYKFNKYVSVGGYYRFIKKRETKEDFYSRNRFYGELELSYPFNRFEVSYRYRFQRQKNKYAEDEEDKNPILINRHKLGLSYNIKGVKLSPSIFYERFYRLKYTTSYYPTDVRYGIDLNYRFNKKHAISLGYLIDKDIDRKEKFLYALTLNYKLTIK